MRILLIDDDAQVLGAIQAVLEFDGHEVVMALGGQAGIDTFQSSNGGSKPFDVVLTDLGMPRVDGRRVASVVKQSSPTTAIVLLTGSGEAPADSNAGDFDLVIGKPVRARDLRDALAKYASAQQRR